MTNEPNQSSWLSRRRLLGMAGAVGASVVVGFHPASSRWITEAEAAITSGMSKVPPLDGELAMDDRTRAAHASDAGNIVDDQTPNAVLYPGSVTDIQKMIRYCRTNGIKVATNTGQNSVLGQTLVNGGLLIDGRSLDTIHSITPDGADVGGGVLWMDLIKKAFEEGLTPPAITGYTQLGVAGTLSIGGLGAMTSNTVVSQADQVQRLQVVTGAGDLVDCSPTENADLFNAMCAGQGQCGVIVRATVNMVPAPDRVRFYRAPYGDVSRFFSDMRTLRSRVEQPDGFSWIASVNVAGMVGLVSLWAAVAYTNGNPPPRTDVLMRGCSPTARGAVPVDLPYLDYVFQVDTMVDTFRTVLGWDALVKPWFNVILPEEGAEDYVRKLFSTLTTRDVSPTTFALVMPALRSGFTRPLFRVPDSGKWAWVCGILTNSTLPGPNPTFAKEMLDRNHRWWTDAAAIGGTRYVEDAVRFSVSDWKKHYGSSTYATFAGWKKKFDPDGILGPGAGIF